MIPYLKDWLKAFFVLFVCLIVIFLPMYIAGYYKNMNFMCLLLLTLPTGFVILKKIFNE